LPKLPFCREASADGSVFERMIKFTLRTGFCIPAETKSVSTFDSRPVCLISAVIPYNGCVLLHRSPLNILLPMASRQG